MAERLRVFVSGRVQGVGFRYATVAQARALGLAGWVRNLPDEFSATYEAKGVYNEISNFFHETGENQTRWVMNSEFKFSGLMRLMGIFMRGAFPKQTLKSMQSFKNFAESEGA